MMIRQPLARSSAPSQRQEGAQAPGCQAKRDSQHPHLQPRNINGDGDTGKQAAAPHCPHGRYLHQAGHVDQH